MDGPDPGSKYDRRFSRCREFSYLEIRRLLAREKVKVICHWNLMPVCFMDDNGSQLKSMENWEIWPTLSTKPLNRWSQNLVWVMTSAQNLITIRWGVFAPRRASARVGAYKVTRLVFTALHGSRFPTLWPPSWKIDITSPTVVPYGLNLVDKCQII